METTFILKGMLVGLLVAAPVGPIGVLCINRTLTQGRTIGLVTGLGAATADATYGGVASFGLSAVSMALIDQRIWIGLVGGLFLCFLGGRTFRAEPVAEERDRRRSGLLAAYLSTFLLTLANPATILSLVAVFAGCGLAAAPSAVSASLLVAGVFLGSALWWLLLSGGVSIFRSGLTRGRMRVVNRSSGAVLFAFGVYSLGASLVSIFHGRS